jgi:hypothetical protein
MQQSAASAEMQLRLSAASAPSELDMVASRGWARQTPKAAIVGQLASLAPLVS